MWLSSFGIATLQWIINTSRINDNDPEIWLQMMDNSPIVEEVLNNDNNPKDVLVNKEHKDGKNKSDEEYVDVKKETKEKVTPKEKKEKTTTKKGNAETYTVKSGDNLAKIANDYEVEISDLKEWNNLSSDKILIGQKLKIYSDTPVSTKSKKTSQNTHKNLIHY